MSNKRPTPLACSVEIYQENINIATLEGGTRASDARFIEAVTKLANVSVSLDYCGGVTNVLHHGNKESKRCLLEALAELKSNFPGTVSFADE